MGEGIPSSSFSLGREAYTDMMMRIVVRRLMNGVDRIESIDIVPRAATFPVHSRLLDMDDPQERDLVLLGLEEMGVFVPDGATMAGGVYDDGDETHIMAWRCKPAGVPDVPYVPHWFVALATELKENAALRRCVYAALLALVFLIPSPWEMYRLAATITPASTIVDRPADGRIWLTWLAGQLQTD